MVNPILSFILSYYSSRDIRVTHLKNIPIGNVKCKGSVVKPELPTVNTGIYQYLQPTCAGKC